MEVQQDQDIIQLLTELIESEQPEKLQETLDAITPSETAWAISRLSHEHQSALLSMLSPEDAASVVEDIGEQHATEVFANLEPETAAHIVEEMESDERADLLNEISESNESGAEAILEQMEQKDAKDLRKLMKYDADVAGGLMHTEVLSVLDSLTVGDVRSKLAENSDYYSDYDIQYVFVITSYKMLVGVLRLRDLVFSSNQSLISELMIPNPISVKLDTPLKELIELFEDYNFIGVPVTDKKNRLSGIVRRASVLEAVEKREGKSFLQFAGIVGGEEYRSMPVKVRAGRRLSWLSINIVLNCIAITVLAANAAILESWIYLAIFMPIISDMSGCSGNQAVAVSMRELNKGLVKPKEIFYTMFKEFQVGIINGTVLGILVGIITTIWTFEPLLGIVLACALAANTVMAVCLGGIIPLILKTLKLDPALVSSPLLTTVTDMCGFFFVVTFASIAMQYM